MKKTLKSIIALLVVGISTITGLLTSSLGEDIKDLKNEILGDQTIPSYEITAEEYYEKLPLSPEDLSSLYISANLENTFIDENNNENKILIYYNIGKQDLIVSKKSYVGETLVEEEYAEYRETKIQSGEAITESYIEFRKNPSEGFERITNDALFSAGFGNGIDDINGISDIRINILNAIIKQTESDNETIPVIMENFYVPVITPSNIENMVVRDTETSLESQSKILEYDGKVLKINKLNWTNIPFEYIISEFSQNDIELNGQKITFKAVFNFSKNHL